MKLLFAGIRNCKYLQNEISNLKINFFSGNAMIAVLQNSIEAFSKVGPSTQAGPNPFDTFKSIKDSEIDKLEINKINFHNFCISHGIDNRLADIEVQWTENKHDYKTGKRAIIWMLKEISQLYWLRHLENFFVKIFLVCIQDMVKKAVQDNIKEPVFVLAMPEFFLQDYENSAFCEPVAAKFFYNNQTCQGMPVDIQRRHVLQSVSDWSYVKPHIIRTCPQASNFQNIPIVLFSGTMVWKAREIDKSSSIFYNTASVFFQGAPVLVWDKIKISSEDGKGTVERHRHVELAEDGLNLDALRVAPSAHMTSIVMRALHRPLYTPVFNVSLYNKNVSFGLSVCLDYSRADFILPPASVDIHVLIAAGMSFYGDLSKIHGKKAFLCCDGMHYNGFGRSGIVVSLDASDSKLWASTSDCGSWDKADTSIIIERCMQSFPMSFGGKGADEILFYVCPNVIEI